MKGKDFWVLWCLPLALFLLLGGCSGKHPIDVKIHTEPEGAHIIYSVDNMEWIYLGVTPLEAVQVLDEDELEDGQTFTLKAMRCGYLNQSKQWTADKLYRENKAEGKVLWTPRLIRAVE